MQQSITKQGSWGIKLRRFHYKYKNPGVTKVFSTQIWFLARGYLAWICSSVNMVLRLIFLSGFVRSRVADELQNLLEMGQEVSEGRQVTGEEANSFHHLLYLCTPNAWIWSSQWESVELLHFLKEALRTSLDFSFCPSSYIFTGLWIEYFWNWACKWCGPKGRLGRIRPSILWLLTWEVYWQ